MPLDPLSDFLAFVPTGIVPNHHQVLFPLLFSHPKQILQELQGRATIGLPRAKAQPNLPSSLLHCSVASHCLGLLVLSAPSLQAGLGKPAEPALVLPRQHPVGPGSTETD